METTTIKKGLSTAWKAFKNEMQRVVSSIALLCFYGLTLMAQSTSAGAGAIHSIASEIKAYQEPVKELIYSIALVIAIIGAFNIYHKMNNGDQDTKKTAMMVIGGCIALVALANALPSFFE